MNERLLYLGRCKNDQVVLWANRRGKAGVSRRHPANDPNLLASCGNGISQVLIEERLM